MQILGSRSLTSLYNSATAWPWGQLLGPGMPPPPGAGEALGMGAVPVAAFLGREMRGEREGGRDRGRQLATAVLKTSSMLLGGIEGKKNQTLNKTEQPNQQNTALREVSGTVLMRFQAARPGSRQKGRK